MLKITLIFLLLLSKITFSQVNEHFNNGNFTQDPVWQGDANYFIVNAQKQLQSNGPQIASQTISLSTANEYSLNTSWEFFVQLNFDPTTTNFVRIYLTSTQADLKSALNGYYVQIGETGSTDGYHLYRQSGSTSTRIITGPQKVRANPNLLSAKIKVTRDDNGKWFLYTDVNNGSNFTLEGTVTDKTFTTSAYMGVYCKYATASRYNQYIFDDFVVDELIPDLTPPTLKNIFVLDPRNIEAVFSKPLNQSSAQIIGHYSLSNGYGQPLVVSPTAVSTIYRLTYANDFTTGNYSLTVNGISDKKGIVAIEDSKVDFFYIKPYFAKIRDVVINEIFANPKSSPALPQKEFLELWNTSSEYILMKGWKYGNQTSTYTFSTDTIKPGQLIILCANADTALFKAYGKTIGLSPWPNLNNDKGILTLVNEGGTVVDRVAYYDTWYKDAVKKKGGFSLEMIDPNNICTGIQNWSVTVDETGGTPGKENSVYRAQISTEAPKLLTALLVDSITVELLFSKEIDSLSASNGDNYRVNNGIGRPQTVMPKATSFNTVVLKFAQPFMRGISNLLTVTNITDCAGNMISADAGTATLFLAKKPIKTDILISEVLFNPKPKGVDFVEIYNNSDHVLDLKDLQLANTDASGKPANIKHVSAVSLFIPAKTYWVLTTNSTNIKANYHVEFPNRFVQMSSLPAYNNDKGTVILLSNNQILDRFDYTEKMHIALLHDAHGVSLERVSFEKSSNEAGNFRSAAATVGFATPTYKNSQEINGKESYVKLISKTFSPDGDGFEDVLKLEYSLNESSSLATVNVYTDKGKLVRKILKNQTIGTFGHIYWDGLNDGGGKCAVGIYVVVFESFDINGNIKKYKNTCVLATKLN